VTWGFLPGTLFCVGVATALFLVWRAERQSGEVLFGISIPMSMSATRYPVLFKLRLASYWIGIVIFGVGGLAFLAELLGIVQ
jgi:hypothetical protein